MITRLLYVLHTPEYVATPTVTFAEDGLKPPGQFEFVYADSEATNGNESLFWSAVENRPVGDERLPFTESDAYSSDFEKDMPNLQYVSKVKLVQLNVYHLYRVFSFIVIQILTVSYSMFKFKEHQKISTPVPEFFILFIIQKRSLR